MNSPLLHALYLGVPLALLVVLALLIFSGKSNHPATYRMSEPWSYGPLLWAATDEALRGYGHGHGHAEVTVGGGASGRW